MTTKAERAHWDRIAEIGCIACLQDGVHNTHVSIHHVDGRTKPGAHMKVLALCYFHHQGGTEENPSVHPWKSAFIKKYGTQQELLDKTKERLA